MKYKSRRYYIYYAAKVLFFFVRLIPRFVSLKVADFLGRIAFRVLGKYRRITLSNLNDVFTKDLCQNRRIAEGVFRNLAKTGADWAKLAVLDKRSIETLVTDAIGLERLDKELAKKKGAIVVTAHFGNWELVGLYLLVKGYKGAVIGRRIYFHKYDKFVTRLRNRFGSVVIYRDESPKKMLKVLKDGNILGLLADQDLDSVEGVFVDFFGKKAFTPTAPVRLALASGASLVPVFVVRKPDNTYTTFVEEPISITPSEDRDRDVKHYTQIWTGVLERYVRRFPEQWVWVHARWKTKEKTVGTGAEGRDRFPVGA